MKASWNFVTLFLELTVNLYFFQYKILKDVINWCRDKAAGSFSSGEEGEISGGGTVVVHSWGPLCSLTVLITFVSPFKFVKLPEP